MSVMLPTANEQLISSVVEEVRANIDRTTERDRSFISDLLRAYDLRRLSRSQEFWLRKKHSLLMSAPVQPAQPIDPMLSDGLAPILTLFRNASKSLKTPRVFLTHEGFDYVLSLAGLTSKFPGTVNVMTRGSFENRTWFGRVNLAGNFEPSLRVANAATLRPMLKELAVDPLNFLKLHGKETGQCCLCGRQLTNKISIEAGIGPICAEKFGL